MKAPSSADRPTAWVTDAEVRATRSTVRVNSSTEWAEATQWNSGRNTQRPTASMPTTTATPLTQRDAERSGDAGFGLAAEDGDDHQKGHHRQVLEQQDAQRQPAVARLQLELLGELPGDDGGGRQGEGAAHDQCAFPADAAPPGDGHDDERGEHHLGAAETEHGVAHGQQLRDGDLQSDHEQQKDHTRLAQQMNGVAVGDPAERVGTGDDADEQVAEDGRQVDASEYGDGHHAQREQE